MSVYRGGVSPRARAFALTGAAALGVAAATVGLTIATTPAERPPAIRPGTPPLVLDLATRTDREAEDLRRGRRLYELGRRERAGQIFRRYRSPQARVGAAFAAWPSGSLARLEQLARRFPDDSAVQVNLGLARFWVRDADGARAAWRAAVRGNPDSSAAVRAEDLLYPNFPRGLPTFVPSFPAPRWLTRLAPARQFAALQRAARRRDVRLRILYGVSLQRLERPLSARRAFAAAVRLDPKNVEAQVAAAVARFEKARPAEAFSRLGPLARAHPRSPTVRFHLGLLLLWLADRNEGIRQLRLARTYGRGTTQLGREADRLLDRLDLGRGQ